MMTPLESALQYAEWGWHVFPIYEMADGACACGAKSCAAGKHPRTRRGFKEATTDAAFIRGWWTEWPNANIGIATGPSGIFVLDVDPKNGGEDSLTKLMAEFGEAAFSTLRVRTGGTGYHFYYRNQAELSSTASVIATGIDTRGMGGYVLAPGSNHKSGGVYEWGKGGYGPLSMAPTPEWAITKVKIGKPGKDGPAPAVPGRVSRGARNDTATSLAGTMHRRGFTPNAIYAALKVQSDETFEPPMSDGELRAIAHNVTRYKRLVRIEEPPKTKSDRGPAVWWTW